MPDYQKMYHILFNAMADAIRQLQDATCRTEEVYLSAEEPRLVVLDDPEDGHSEEIK